MRFILEHSLAPRLAAALNALSEGEGNEVIHLRTFVAETDATDVTWINELVVQGQTESVVVTADPSILKNPAERAAWRTSGVTMFFLKGFAALPRWEQAARIVKWFPAIQASVKRARKGAGFIVTVNGKIEPYDEERHRR